MGFKKADERIDSDSLDAVWAVLVGDSSWKEYIRPAAEACQKNMARQPFRVVPPADYAPELAKLDKTASPIDTPGVTDKKNGIVWVQGYFGTKSREGMLGHALHELVHLISHEPGVSGKDHSTALGLLGNGLLEGLVELITSDILTTQGIALADSGKRGHQKRVPVVQELMDVYGIGSRFLGPALFRGDQRLFRIAEAGFTTAGWIEIQRLTTSDNPDGAKRRLKELRAKEEKANPGKFTSSKMTVIQVHQVFRAQSSNLPPPPARF